MAETRPTERTPFFEFQARNRRATWRLTLTYALVVGGCGLLPAVGFVANVFLVLLHESSVASVFGVDAAPLTPKRRTSAMGTCDGGVTPT